MSFEFDGMSIPLREGMTVAAALWASGRRTWRITARGQLARGYYCGDGLCYDCLPIVDGEPNVRACHTAAATGISTSSAITIGHQAALTMRRRSS